MTERREKIFTTALLGVGIYIWKKFSVYDLFSSKERIPKKRPAGSRYSIINHRTGDHPSIAHWTHNEDVALAGTSRSSLIHLSNSL